MRIYIATRLDNIERAKNVIEVLEANGHIINYNWTQHGDVRNKGKSKLTDTARDEVFAVVDAALVLVMLPGGKGTHTELGIALASRNNKRILLWSETGKELQTDENTCVFYHHLSIEHVICSFEKLLEKLQEI